MSDDKEDPWGAFGGEESDDDGFGFEDGPSKEEDARSLSVALFLAQQYLKRKAKLPEIRVHILELIADDSQIDDCTHDLKSWKRNLCAKGFNLSTSKSHQDDIQIEKQLLDSIIVLSSTVIPSDKQKYLSDTLRHLIVPGGTLVLSNALVVETNDSWDSNIWHTIPMDTTLGGSETGSMVLFHKWACPIQCDPKNCPWLPHNPQKLLKERERLEMACVLSTANEQETRFLSEASIEQAVHHLNHYGYCVIPRLLDPNTCQKWGDVILSDLKQAAAILLEREGVDLFNPFQSACDPATYRELSMREDLRMDLRHGPSLDNLRGGPEGCRPWTVRARDPLSNKSDEEGLPQRFFRGHAQLLEIVRRLMNPKDETLASGNFGRYNFSGSGPEGSFQDLRVGPVGGIVTLPGSADQAVHADTPHLFEHMDALPAHYVNAFTPGCRANAQVGQTAFVHASHRLQFCAHNTKTRLNSGKEATEDGWKSHVVRPLLNLGDVLLFDCRVLHFGMANTSTSVQRPLIYTNMTQHWFQDPKNWDDQRKIFVQE